MDSKLDPVFGIIMRHAEPLDTRQGIRRHEQTDDKGKKHEKQKQDDEQDIWEDVVSVSVPALKGFLERLLHETGSLRQDPAKNEEIRVSGAQGAGLGPSVQDDNGPSSMRTAHALQAYNRTTAATHAAQGQFLPPEDSAPFAHLEPEDIRVIHTLIDDLGLLDRSGISALTIVKSESFLRSLVTAVETEKQNLKIG